MVLAAGFGTRLLPYTRAIPKVLFPILGKPALLLTLERLERLGFRRVAINLHHLPERIVSALKAADLKIETSLFFEKEILLTGGALKGAATFLCQEEATVIINGDIFFGDLDFNHLLKEHFATGCLVTMVVKRGGGNDNLLVERGKVRALRVQGTHTFCGIQVISPKLIDHLPPGPSDLIDTYQRLAPDGLLAAYETKAYICDFGTRESYLKLHEDLLYRRVHLETEPNLATPLVCLSPIQGVELRDWTFVDQQVVIGPGTLIRRSVVWPGAEIAPRAKVEETIVPPSLIFMP
ncbi:nucleotidyltransferase family protein [Thermosulfuriphilus ammonigenes]|nr:sugar phosphate nucleotidyltransferase [Thermosulfuriphilus ammonigenes]